MRFIIVTGLSGAGKTLTIRYLEDMGFFCIDNLPRSEERRVGVTIVALLFIFNFKLDLCHA